MAVAASAGSAPIPGCTGASRAQAQTRPPNSRILTDEQAACDVRYARWEPRPSNRPFNQTVPSPSELRAFRRHSKNPYRGRITGDFRGTTDEIIQWAAWKWGIDANVLRAVAADESWWNQRFDASDSYGLTSIKQSVYPETFPMIASSTAFNLDVYGAIFRKCYDGRTGWLGRHYHAGDLWGCIGAFYSGSWWSPAARWYIGKVKGELRERVWRRKSFRNGF